jgi:hypothetical protein
MRLQLMLVLLLVLPTVMAYQVNTTVTIDFTGSDMYYLRTESGDMGPYNISDQTDRSYLLNLTRLSVTNQTDMEYISGLVSNLTKSCSNITSYTGDRDKRCNELDANWTRCNLDKNALLLEVIGYESGKINCTNQLNSYGTQINNMQGVYNQCVVTLNNQTQVIADLGKGKSNNLLLGLVIGAGAIGAIWGIKEGDKKKFDRPGEMRRFQ